MIVIVTQNREDCPQNVEMGFYVMDAYEPDSTLRMTCVKTPSKSVDVENDEIVVTASPSLASHAYSPFSYGIPTAAAAFLACCILSSMSSL